MLFKFIGSESDIGGIHLDTFGQTVELSEELSKDAVAGGCTILPVAVFDGIFTDPAEILKYPNPSSRNDAPDEFKQKIREALIEFNKLRG